MRNKRFFVPFLSLSLLLTSLWQIEEIWRSLQNGWRYNLPFGMSTANYWFAHDFWFLIIGLSWVLMLIDLKKKIDGDK